MDGYDIDIPMKNKRRLPLTETQAASPSYPYKDGSYDVTNSNEPDRDLFTNFVDHSKHHEQRNCPISLQETLLYLISCNLHGTNKNLRAVSWRQLSDQYSFFTECVGSSEDVKANSLAFNAVRAKDAEALKQLYVQNGKSILLCRSKSGESLLHMACRRGHLEIVLFLIEEGVPVRIVDKSGRTPLHGACWSAVPQFTIVEYLLRLDPEMLFVQDDDDLTPLEYVPQEHVTQWESFLYRHQRLFYPVHEAFISIAPTTDYSNKFDRNGVDSNHTFSSP